MFSKIFVLVALLAVALGAVIPAFKRDPEWEGRIIGGQVAGINQFSLCTSANDHYCGCSIVNNRWTLSAAHCTVGRTLANARVIVGAHSRTTSGIAHNSARVVNHPNYNTNTIANDVCVIQTATVITFNAAAQPIALGPAAIGGGVVGTVSGWGFTSHPGSNAANLLFVNKTTLGNAACQSQHSVGSAALIFASSLCAGGVNGLGETMLATKPNLTEDGNLVTTEFISER